MFYKYRLMADSVKFKMRLFLLLLMAELCTAQIYSSIRQIQRVADQEKQLIEALDKYVTSEHQDGRNVDLNILSFLDSVKGQHSSQQNGYQFGENPIMAFHLLQRLVEAWDQVISVICCQSCMVRQNVKDFHMTVSDIKYNSGQRAKVEDVHGAAGAILRLWDTYQLDLDKLMDGVIANAKTEPLTAKDIVTIVKYAHDRGKYYDEIIWLEKLLAKYELSSGEVVSVKRKLASAYNNFGMPWKAVDILSPLQESGNDTIKAEYHYYMSMNYSTPDKSKTLKPEYVERDEVYKSLCRGDIRSAEEKSSQKCFLRSTKIPYYRSKEEVVNYIPRISLFHDVISSSESQFIKETSGDLMTRSMVAPDAPKIDDNGRVSYTGWLKDDAYPDGPLKKISRRIGLITGLDTTYRANLSSVEQYQALNYGVGGMYLPHYDNLNMPIWDIKESVISPDVKYSGERLATWMFYLHSVKAGGATVFPLLRARVPVVEGGAAFWYNVLPNGQNDERTLHAGCPVLLGSKWVCNKWIHQEGQVLTKLCGLNSDGEFENPINS